MEVWRVIEDAHEEPIMCTAYNKARKELYSGAQDSLIKVWDVDSGRLVRTQVGHRGWLTDVIFIDAVAMLVSCSADGRILVWNDRGKELQSLEFHNGGPAFCLGWNYKRNQLVVGGDGVVGLYRLLRPDALELASVTAARFQTSTHTRRDGVGVPMPAGVNDGGDPSRPDALKVLKLLGTVHSHSDIVRGVCCSDTGRIYSAGYDKCICILDSEKPKELPSVEAKTKFEKCHSGAICSVAFDTDNNWLITGSYDGVVKIWSKEGHCLDEFERLNDTVTGVCYVPATKNYWLTNSRQMVAYDPRSPQNITEYIKETSRFEQFHVHKLHQTPSDDLVIGMTTAKSLVVWRYNPWAAYRVLYGHTDWCESLVGLKRPGPDGRPTPQVYSAGSDGVIIRWQPSGSLSTDLYTVAEEMPGAPAAVLCLVYSAELDALISGVEDGSIHIWELSGLGLQRPKPSGAAATEGPNADTLLGHEGRVSGLACVGEHVLASVSQDASLRFWDLHTKHELAVVEKAHEEPILGLDYAPEREELATCASEPVVHIWSAFAYTLKARLVGHTGDVTAVKWCGWKDLWVTASEDESIRFWAAADQTCVRNFHYRGENVTCMMIDPVYQTLLAAMADFQLRVYDVEKVLTSAPTEEVLPIRKHVGHTEPIRSICLVEEKRQYLTASWDKTVRVWRIPRAQGAGTEADAQRQAEAAAEEEAAAMTMGDEEEFVSSFEREHPLIQPKALRANANAADFAFKLAKGDAGLHSQYRGIEEELPMTQLGNRLQEMEEELQRAHYNESGKRSPHPHKHRSRNRNQGRPAAHG